MIKFSNVTNQTGSSKSKWTLAEDIALLELKLNYKAGGAILSTIFANHIGKEDGVGSLTYRFTHLTKGSYDARLRAAKKIAKDRNIDVSDVSKEEIDSLFGCSGERIFEMHKDSGEFSEQRWDEIYQTFMNDKLNELVDGLSEAEAAKLEELFSKLTAPISEVA